MPPSGSEAAAAGAEAAEGGQSVLDDSALMSTGTGGGGSQDGGGAADASSRSPGGVAGTAEEAEAGRTGGSDEAAPDAGSADDPPPVAAAAAAAAAQAAGQPPPLLTYVGVGEAGWGCPGAAQSFRGCRWTARAGLVLRLPDHARLRQLGLTLSGGGGGGGEGDRSGPAALPLVLFRGWGLQLEGQGRALKGLSKADWPNFGFALMGAPQAGAGERRVGMRLNGRTAQWAVLRACLPLRRPHPSLTTPTSTCADGTLTATLRCAQPASGARLEAAVVHLVPCEHRGLAESGKAPALSAGYEVGGGEGRPRAAAGRP